MFNDFEGASLKSRGLEKANSKWNCTVTLRNCLPLNQNVKIIKNNNHAINTKDGHRLDVGRGQQLKEAKEGNKKGPTCMCFQTIQFKTVGIIKLYLNFFVLGGLSMSLLIQRRIYSWWSRITRQWRSHTNLINMSKVSRKRLIKDKTRMISGTTVGAFNRPL